jgi:hypothetical protein
MLHIIFFMGAVETLAGIATCGEGGGGLEVHMNFLQGDCLEQNNS